MNLGAIGQAPGPRTLLERVEPAPWPCLAGLGTACPRLRLEQAVVSRQLAKLWGLSGARLARWHRIVAGTGIDYRHGVLPLEQVMGLSTAQRMDLYERHAPPLARTAAREALERACVDPADVTDLVVVSCTGFSAPGLDVDLIESLGLRPTVRRTMIGFMGCFGAIVGLRNAAATAGADPAAVVLVLSVELCSLHVRADRSTQNQVASALFADGAAAAVVTGRRDSKAPGPRLARLSRGHTRLIPEGRDWMTWRITDQGFAMTLAREVAAALRETVAEVVLEGAVTPPRSFVVHPGGPAILDAIDSGLGLDGGRGLEVSRRILRDYGNMSSATILFVLAEALRTGHRPPAMLLAFGPGLTIETLMAL